MTLHPDTLAVHAGYETAEPASGAAAVPLYMSTGFVFEDTKHAADLFALARPGHIYTRISNPTEDIFEQRMCTLEGGVGALAVASGMTAITFAVCNLARHGDNIVALTTLYGGTYTFFTHTLPEWGIEVRFVEPDQWEKLPSLVDERTRLVFAETIGNPAMNVADLDEWSQAAHALGLPLVVDNSVATPILCRPIDHGADIVVHSTTKYTDGHGSGVGGMIIDAGTFDWAGKAERFPTLVQPDVSYHGVVWTDAAGPAAFITRARTVLLRNIGAAISPFNAWLQARSLDTLPLRIERHSSNALAVARHLAQHPAVAWVSYPGLDGPDKAVADRVFTGRGYSGLILVGVKSGREGAMRFIDNLKLWENVTNFGDTKSLVQHNASTTHSQLSDDEMRAAGVAPEGVRLSVGIEYVADLIADLDQALAA